MDFGTGIYDNSIVIEVKGWLRFKILRWLLKDARKIKVENKKED